MIQVCIEERWVDSLLDGSFHRGWFTNEIKPGMEFELVVLMKGWKRPVAEWQTGLILVCVAGDVIDSMASKDENWMFYRYAERHFTRDPVEMDAEIRARRRNFPDEEQNPNARLLP
jgi:hypothetical protein